MAHCRVYTLGFSRAWRSPSDALQTCSRIGKRVALRRTPKARRHPEFMPSFVFINIAGCTLILIVLAGGFAKIDRPHCHTDDPDNRHVGQVPTILFVFINISGCTCILFLRSFVFINFWGYACISPIVWGCPSRRRASRIRRVAQTPKRKHRFILVLCFHQHRRMHL